MNAVYARELSLRCYLAFRWSNNLWNQVTFKDFTVILQKIMSFFRSHALIIVNELVISKDYGVRSTLLL